MRRLLRLVPALTALAVLWLALTASAESTPSTTLKLATVAPDGTPWAAGLQSFKAMVEKTTAGRVVVRPFLGGVLGDENETVIACQRGQIQGVGASTGAVSSVVPELSVLELPFLFRNAAEADHILDTVILSTVEAALKSRGLILGFWSENGYRSFGTDYGFIKSPADLAGHKMRSQETGVHLEMYRAFGASPVPIPVTEVLTSMQTGVIDGYDNTPLFALAAQWTSVTKYYTLTNHIYQPAAILFNAAWFNALSPEDQKTLLSARTGMAVQMRKEIRALHPLLLENLQGMDVQVYTPTTAELATFQAPAKAARDKYLATASAGEKALFAKITAGLTEYRKTHP
jgi:tripartite ATP-independent transporter DctP family solute receptor